MTEQNSLANVQTDRSDRNTLHPLAYLLRDLAEPMTYLGRAPEAPNVYHLAPGKWGVFRIRPERGSFDELLAPAPYFLVRTLLTVGWAREFGDDGMVLTSQGIRAALTIPEPW